MRTGRPTASRGHGRAAAAALAACLLLASHPTGAEASHADEPVERQQFEIVRTTDGPASFRLDLQFFPAEGSDDIDAFEGSAWMRTDHRGRVTDVTALGASTIGHDDTSAIFVNGKSVGGCDVGQCDVHRTFGARSILGSSDEGGDDVPNRVYVVVEFQQLEVDFEGDGWTLVERPLTYRYVDYRRAEGVGASIAMQGADLFLGATAPGGRWGSVAVGSPPCSGGGKQSTVGVGVGDYSLRGGVEEPAGRCPAVTNPTLADHAPDETTWRMDGIVAGSNALTEVRLFVIDLPPCDERLPGVIGPPEDRHPCAVPTGPSS